MVFSKLRIVFNAKYFYGVCFLWVIILVVLYVQSHTISWKFIPKRFSQTKEEASMPQNFFHNFTQSEGVDAVTSKPSANAKEITPPKKECIIPELKASDPVMMKHYKKLSRTKCPGEKNWVYVQNGTVKISPDAVKAHKGVTCDYYPFLRKTDYKVEFGAAVKNISDGYTLKTDAFKVLCNGTDGAKYDNVHLGVAFNKEFLTRPQDPLRSGFEGLSIAILGFDSMSRMSWLRRLSETRKFFVEKLGAIELESHNILGDGTTAVMFPMLTGEFEWELPECRRKFKGAKPMDNFPWLWRDFQKAGYLTSWSNASPGSAPFNWRMLGFEKQPTDFYARNFYLEAGKRYNKAAKLCLRSKTRSRVWLDYFRDIFYMYKQQRKFLFHFMTDMSHDDNNLLTAMDDDIKEMIEDLHNGNYLNNTLFILMGDHGARYFQVRSTLSGKLEERLPYFSFLFPPWFEKKYPDAIKNIRINAQRLTTPFDLYYTFKEFLNFTGAGVGNVDDRGLSLFKEVPLNRSCKHADIAPHWCACLAWKNVSIKDQGAKEALHVALDTINGYTSEYRSDCALLSVANVTMAMKLETRSELLKFSSADQNGGIYKINFASKHKLDKILYQITFYTSPGGGHFEVTITHDLMKKKYFVSEKEISRINKYGNAPHCVLDRNKQIRQYCYCKDLI